MIHQMKGMNFPEPDRLSFRNKVVVTVAVSKKSIKIERSRDASFAFNYDDIFPVGVK